MSKYDEIKQIYKNQGKEDDFNTIIENRCSYVERQTDYSSEVALNKLIEHELDVPNVIKEWLGIPAEKPNVYRSPNQMIYDEFRSFLDEAAKNYYKNKE